MSDPTPHSLPDLVREALALEQVAGNDAVMAWFSTLTPQEQTDLREWLAYLSTHLAASMTHVAAIWQETVREVSEVIAAFSPEALARVFELSVSDQGDDAPMLHFRFPPAPDDPTLN